LHNQRGRLGVFPEVVVKALQRQLAAVAKGEDQVLTFFAQVGVALIKGELQLEIIILILLYPI